jgi:hypothetical protein
MPVPIHRRNLLRAPGAFDRECHVAEARGISAYLGGAKSLGHNDFPVPVKPPDNNTPHPAIKRAAYGHERRSPSRLHLSVCDDHQNAAPRTRRRTLTPTFGVDNRSSTHNADFETYTRAFGADFHIPLSLPHVTVLDHNPGAIVRLDCCVTTTEPAQDRSKSQNKDCKPKFH